MEPYHATKGHIEDEQRGIGHSSRDGTAERLGHHPKSTDSEVRVLQTIPAID